VESSDEKFTGARYLVYPAHHRSRGPQRNKWEYGKETLSTSHLLLDAHLKEEMIFLWHGQKGLHEGYLG
jgi:hypothetical protein